MDQAGTTGSWISYEAMPAPDLAVRIGFDPTTSATIVVGSGLPAGEARSRRVTLDLEVEVDRASLAHRGLPSAPSTHLLEEMEEISMVGLRTNVAPVGLWRSWFRATASTEEHTVGLLVLEAAGRWAGTRLGLLGVVERASGRVLMQSSHVSFRPEVVGNGAAAVGGDAQTAAGDAETTGGADAALDLPRPGTWSAQGGGGSVELGIGAVQERHQWNPYQKASTQRQYLMEYFQVDPRLVHARSAGRISLDLPGLEMPGDADGAGPAGERRPAGRLVRPATVHTESFLLQPDPAEADQAPASRT